MYRRLALDSSYLTVLMSCIVELGEQGLTPASSQVTYLLLRTSFLLASLSYHYAEYKNDYPFHSITFFMPRRLRLCVCYMIS